MKRLLAVGLVASGAMFAQTLGQLRLVDFSPKTVATIASGGVLGSGPINITTVAPHGLSNGWIYVYAPLPLSSLDSNTYKWGNWGRGYFGITVTGPNKFTITSEMYTGATTGIGNGIAAGDKIVPLTTYYVRQGPKIWRDGPIAKGEWSNAKAYRAFESVTYLGNTYMAIAANISQLPTNTTYWKQIDPSRVGPGTFSASLRDNSSNGRVNSANYPYAKLTSLDASYCGLAVGWDVYTGSGTGYCNGLNAWRWFADDNATAGTMAVAGATQIEDMTWGGLACDESQAYCGRKAGDFDTNRLDAWYYLPALEVVYDILTPAQRATLNNKLLNDRSYLHNGVDDSDCTPVQYIPGASSSADTITVKNYTITGTGFLSKAGLAAGSIIYARAFSGWSLEPMGRVKSVDSDTQMTMEHCPADNCRVSGKLSGYQPQYWGFYAGTEPGSSTAGSDTPWYYSKPWNDSDHACGLKWYIAHHPSTPRTIPGQEGNYGAGTKDYGSIASVDNAPENNRTYSNAPIWAAIGLMTANNDIRGVRLAEQIINYYMTQNLAQDAKSRWGTEGHGTQYGPGRVQKAAFMVAWMIRNSLTVTPPGITTGTYLSNLMRENNHSPWLGMPIFEQPYDTGYGINRNQDMDYGQAVGLIAPALMMAPALYPGDPYVGYSWDYLRNRRNDYANAGGNSSWSSLSMVPFLWVFWNPATTPQSISMEPRQFALTESDQEECLAAGLYCVVDAKRAVAHSVTGWTPTDTQLMIHGPSTRSGMGEDGYGFAGNISILQNNGNYSAYLLGGNGLGVGGLGTGQAPIGGKAGSGSQLMIHNGSSELYSSNLFNSYEYASMDRWAGALQTGVSDSSYVYARVNLTPDVRDPSTGYTTTTKKSIFTSASGALASSSLVTREALHLKNGANRPNYVIAYDYGHISIANQLRAYWHLQATPNKMTLKSMTERHPEWVSYDPAGKIASITVPNTGRLNLKTLAVAGSTNPTVALSASNYALPGPTEAITSISWSAGEVTLTTVAGSANGYQNSYPLPTDGSATITVAGVTPAAYNGSFPVTGGNSKVAAGGTRVIKYALAGDPGSAGTGGNLTFPSWCTYVTSYNKVGTCNGSYDIYSSQFESPWPATYRVHACPSNDGLTCSKVTDGEMLTVLQPSASTTNTMPPLNQPTCSGTGANCTALEILDASYPRVAMMARQGALARAMAITSTHPGVAQYTVTGLAPGTYVATMDGAVIANATVTERDTTLSFSSAAGQIAVNQTSGPARTGLLVLNPSSLHFTCSSNGTASAPQIINIAGTDVTLDNWTATKSASWLTLSASAGSTDGTITASVNCAGLPSGAYSDDVVVGSTTSGLSNSPQRVAVSLTRYSAPSITTSTLPPGSVGVPYWEMLAATGGLPPYSWNISAGTLCDGLVLSASGVISGTPLTAQVCSFRVQMTNAQSESVSSDFSISVGSSRSTITMAVTPSSAVFSCTQNGGDPPPQVVTVGSTGGLLDNWTANQTEGWLSSVPASGVSPGTFELIVNCTDLSPGIYSDSVSVASSTAGVANSPINVLVELSVNPPPRVQVSGLTSGTWGNAYRQVLTANGGQAPYVWGVASGDLPPGLSLSSAGVLEGIPAQRGTWNFTVQATDAGGAVTTQALSVFIKLGSVLMRGTATIGGAAKIE